MFKREFSEYLEQRKTIEHSLYPAGFFYRSHHLNDFITSFLHNLFVEYYKNSGRKQQCLQAAYETAQYLFQHGIRILLILIGAVMISQKQISAGELLSGLFLLPSVSRWYKYGASVLTGLKHEKECCKRIRLFYEEEPENHLKAPDSKQIVLKKVSFSYP